MPDATRSFQNMLSKRAEEANSRLILALDLSVEMTSDTQRWEEKQNELVKKIIQVLDCSPELAALKFNHQLTLPLGIFSDGMHQIMEAADQSGPVPKIMDCKASDVGHTNAWIAEHYFDAGFDALIANPLIGFKGGIEEISQIAKERGRGLILLCVMSHPGASFCFTRTVMHENEVIPAFELVAQNSAKWGTHGLIVGGTYPDLIARVRSIIPPEMLIFSPGIGAQGGNAMGLREAGTDYFIVGRSIFKAKKPMEAARRFRLLSLNS
ncbi:MAG: orotidine 5'-phosphate decarboxylase [Candidatus Heimdallarchaeota archaeon]